MVTDFVSKVFSDADIMRAARLLQTLVKRSRKDPVDCRAAESVFILLRVQLRDTGTISTGSDATYSWIYRYTWEFII